MILTVYSFAIRFVNMQLAHKQSCSVPKMTLNVSLHCFDVICTLVNVYVDLLELTRIADTS